MRDRIPAGLFEGRRNPAEQPAGEVDSHDRVAVVAGEEAALTRQTAVGDDPSAIRRISAVAVWLFVTELSTDSVSGGIPVPTDARPTRQRPPSSPSYSATPSAQPRRPRSPGSSAAMAATPKR